MPTTAYVGSNALSFLVTAFLTLLMHRFVNKSELSQFLVLQSLVFGFASFFSGLEQYLSKNLNLHGARINIIKLIFGVSSFLVIAITLIDVRVFGSGTVKMTLIALLDLSMLISYSLLRGITLGLHFNIVASVLTATETTIRLFVTVLGIKLHIFLLVLISPALSNFPVAVAASCILIRKKSLLLEGAHYFKTPAALSLMVQSPLSSIFTQALVFFVVSIRPILSSDEGFLRFSSLLPIFRWPVSAIGLFSGLLIPWFSRYGTPTKTTLRRFLSMGIGVLILTITVVPYLDLRLFGVFPGFNFLNYMLINFAFLILAYSLLLTSRNIALHLEYQSARAWLISATLVGGLIYLMPPSKTLELLPSAFVFTSLMLLLQLIRFKREEPK